ncbi:pimeloyl-ACP methyl ester carboxylesterase [Streptomyces sp. 3211.6]|uniref:alpha/beta hydrolase n=1 Tax=Streptomyces sp. 3211.6 TaxID=1938845 RepID=UPI000EAE9BDA|nr:alpha/beta hydrolase [Streptomyces sp. 3211.6]RKT02159.1 pimeloyl-ACP methyl ester carboxylesterase [Streptomyces sp. 3211.6]
MSGVVLVHGLYHDPQHFDLVVGELAAARVEVAVPELHRGSLQADTEAVQAVVDAMEQPPLVVGHSYGGSVITGLTGAAHLVYLAAFVPAEGESAARLGGSTTLLASSIVQDGDGVTHVDPAAAVEVFYADAPIERATWAASLLRPQKPGCGRGVPERQSWQSTPSTYVICTQDRAIEPDLQREMSRRCSSTLTWHTSHSPFLSQPGRVAAVLRSLLLPSTGHSQ